MARKHEMDLVWEAEEAARVANKAREAFTPNSPDDPRDYRWTPPDPGEEEGVDDGTLGKAEGS